MGFRSFCSVALGIVLLFAGYLALSIPAATDRTLDKQDILASVTSATNLVELQNFATAKISVLCNYHQIGARLLYISLGVCLLVAVLILFALFSTRSENSD